VSQLLTLREKHNQTCLSNSFGDPFRQCVTIRLVIDWDEVCIRQDISGWTVEMYWKEDDIQGGPSKLVIRPTDDKKAPVGGISSTVLREIDFRTGAGKAREQVAAEDLAYAQDRGPQVPPMALVRATFEAGGITDAYLVLLAIQYIARVGRGEPKPVDHIASELGKSPGTIKGHLWQARNRGLLKGGSAGRKGGYVPPEAAQMAIDFIDKGIAAIQNHAET
jgi:hypothetical protein